MKQFWITVAAGIVVAIVAPLVQAEITKSRQAEDQTPINTD